MKVQPPIRGYDKWGNGAFNAPRGDHTHQGIDIACYKGTTVLAVSAGKVTKIGYPYNPNNEKKGHLRYVQVTDKDGIDVRYFYIESLVSVGDTVEKDEAIGVTQGLEDVYPGITDHFHFEVKQNGRVLNPNKYLRGDYDRS